jgi:hypothetical protein
VSTGPSLHSIKGLRKDNFEIPLQSSGRTLQRRKDSGSVVETFLLVKTSIGCYQVCQVMHCLRYCKTTTKKQVLYTPLPTLDRSWESILMEYMASLLPPRGEMIVSSFLLIALPIWKEEHHNRGHFQDLI